MAPMAQAEAAGGLAFEVQIKSLEGAAVMTPGRARLESYASSGEKLPRLLRASAERAPAACSPEDPTTKGPSNGAAPAEQGEREAQAGALQRSLEQELEKATQKRDASLAEKSSKATKYCQEVQAKVGHCLGEREAQAGALQRGLEQELEKATQKRDASLASRSSKAVKHFQEVQAKAGHCRQQHAASSANQRLNLEQDLEKAAQRRDSSLADRSMKAAIHCQRVQAKAESHQVQHASAAAAQRCRFEQGLNRATQKREMLLTQRTSKAGQHYREVRAKVGGVRQHQADASAEQEVRLSAVALQKNALQIARSVQRSSKAGHHNQRVAEGLARHSQRVEDRRDELREQLQATQRRAATNAAAAAPAARGERARRHNAEVARRAEAQREALRRRAQELMRKGCLVERAAPVAADVEAETEVGGTPMAQGTSSHGTWLKWLASALPCGSQE